jgi:membrane protein
MAREGTSAEKQQTAPPADDARKPDSPTELTKPSWRYTAKKAFDEFGRDQCTDLAAALTYYAVLALFPALLALVSLLGIFGQGESTTNALLDMIRQIGQGNAADQLRGPISQMTQTHSAGFALVFGILGALWSASGYVGAFGRAMNRIYQIDEGRPFWKLRPLQLLITLAGVILAALVLVGLVVSGPIAKSVGDAIGAGSTAQTVWSIAKWPVILAIVVFLVALLYHATPNVKQPKFRWVSVGAGIAILVWVLASILFGFYVSHFGSYNKTYGSLAGVIVFLLWLWLTNLALLFGAEVDSELERSRELQSGIEAEETLQLPPRDDSGSRKRERKLQERVKEGRELRERAGARRGED